MLQISHRNVFQFLAIAACGFVLAGSTAADNQAAFVSFGFASCGTQIGCATLPPCEASDFHLSGSCDASCQTGGSVPFCFGSGTANVTQDSWQTGGFFVAFLAPGGDTPDVQASFGVTGTRPTPEQLDLNGEVFLHIGFEIPFEPEPVEISVFRFSGDPTVFDGVQVPSVFSLVALGLIDADDILFSEALPIPSPLGFEPFSFTVDVSGVPSEEIVVFGSQSGSVTEVPDGDVPALSEWGFVLLVLAILLAARWMLRRRVRTA